MRAWRKYYVRWCDQRSRLRVPHLIATGSHPPHKTTNQIKDVLGFIIRVFMVKMHGRVPVWILKGRQRGIDLVECLAISSQAISACRPAAPNLTFHGIKHLPPVAIRSLGWVVYCKAARYRPDPGFQAANGVKDAHRPPVESEALSCFAYIVCR